MLQDIETPIPPLPALFAHVRPLSDTDKRTIKDTLSEVYVKISKIYAELARLKSAKEKLEQFRDQHERVLSPIRPVPNEILCQIMKSYWDIHTAEGPMSSQRSAVLFASVCSRWRALALSTPQLWSVLFCRRSKKCLPFARLMLSRSAQHNLELHMAYNHHWISYDNRPLMKMIEPHLYRMQCIVSADGKLIAPVHNPGQSLELLRTVKFTFNLTAPELLHFFNNCPVLEDAELVLKTVAQDNSILRVEPPLDIRSLRRLYLQYNGNASVFFQRITAPHLAELSAINGGPEIWRTLPSITDFVRRSESSLIKLSIGSTGSNWAGICSMLDATPHLEELSIDENRFTAEATYEYLRIHATYHSRLKTLTVRERAQDIGPDFLHAMLISRSAVFPISKVVLRFSNYPPSFRKPPFAHLLADSQRLGYSLEVLDNTDQRVVEFNAFDWIFSEEA